ncbi:hypothetical protein MMC09_001477 [Bachmanniomyces sp. S44760]|nr:hypothetical protein [Bachmanniomyces sp. S44760]
MSFMSLSHEDWVEAGRASTAPVSTAINKRLEARLSKPKPWATGVTAKKSIYVRLAEREARKAAVAAAAAEAAENERLRQKKRIEERLRAREAKKAAALAEPKTRYVRAPRAVADKVKPAKQTVSLKVTSHLKPPRVFPGRTGPVARSQLPAAKLAPAAGPKPREFSRVWSGATAWLERQADPNRPMFPGGADRPCVQAWRDICAEADFEASQRIIQPSRTSSRASSRDFSALPDETIARLTEQANKEVAAATPKVRATSRDFSALPKETIARLTEQAKKEVAAATAKARTTSRDFSALPKETIARLTEQAKKEVAAATAKARTTSRDFSPIPQETIDRLMEQANRKVAAAHARARATSRDFSAIPQETIDRLTEQANREVAAAKAKARATSRDFSALPAAVIARLTEQAKREVAEAVSATPANIANLVPRRMRPHAANYAPSSCSGCPSDGDWFAHPQPDIAGPPTPVVSLNQLTVARTRPLLRPSVESSRTRSIPGRPSGPDPYSRRDDSRMMREISSTSSVKTVGTGTSYRCLSRGDEYNVPAIYRPRNRARA